LADIYYALIYFSNLKCSLHKKQQFNLHFSLLRGFAGNWYFNVDKSDWQSFLNYNEFNFSNTLPHRLKSDPNVLIPIKRQQRFQTPPAKGMGNANFISQFKH